MERKPVTSSNIKSIGYENGEMHIEFQGGRIYSYTGAKVEAHYNGLMTTDSVGKYFGANVRNCPDTACRSLDIPAPDVPAVASDKPQSAAESV